MDKQFRKDLSWAMKKTLLEFVNDGNFLLENDVSDTKNWILKEATYEQLLNLCFNQKENKYYDTTLIESLILTERVQLNSRQKHPGLSQKAELATQKGLSADARKKYFYDVLAGIKDYFQSEQGKKVLKIGGLAVLGAIALGVAANYVYKRYFSESAKACKNASDFKACVVKYKKQAIQKTLQRLKQEKSQCSKTSKPEKCNARLNKEISKWENKLQKAA